MHRSATISGDLPSGVREADSFRDEIEMILNAILPTYIPVDRLITIQVSEIREGFDWAGLIDRLVGDTEPVEPDRPHTVTLYPALWD